MIPPFRHPGSVNLRWLLPTASFVGCADITISSVAEHSDQCVPGCLFAALPGTRSHGRDHIPTALLGGAAAILTNRPLADVSLPQCIIPDARQAYGRVCHGLYSFPSQKLGVVGVTGTNGKTTVTWIVRSLLESVAHPTGLIGTIEYNDGLQSWPSSLTTPPSLPLAQMLDRMVAHKTTHAALELSSHALKQDRCAGLTLDVGIITHITSDHLDYHTDHHDYLSSKARIAGHIKRGGILVLNADDPRHEEVLQQITGDARLVTFGCDQPADVQAAIHSMDAGGTRFRLTAGTESVECSTPLIGKHNVSNCLAATCAALHFGMTLSEIAEGLENFPGVPGRLQPIDNRAGISVYVDYAHTEDALRHALAAVKAVTRGRIILAFGAGGNRDASKRAPMGKVATVADSIVVTSDNPRHEDPAAIAEQILQGCDRQKTDITVEFDRRRAIEFAITEARPGDAVLIAGKGHEKIQEFNEQRIPFDDVAVCQEVLSRLAATRSQAIAETV